MEMMEMLAMGEYGPFVWSCYLMTLLVVIVSTIQAKRWHRRITEVIEQRLKVEETDR